MRSTARAMLVFGALIVACGSGCDKNADTKKSKSSEDDEPKAKAKKKPEPDVEIGAEKLGKAYVADPEGTDEKYASKRLRVSGGLAKVSIYDDKAYATLEGPGFTEETKLGTIRKDEHYPNGGVLHISCETTPTSYVKFMAKAFEKMKGGITDKKPAGTIEGKYDKSYPLSKENPAIQLVDCELIEPEKD